MISTLSVIVGEEKFSLGAWEHGSDVDGIMFAYRLNHPDTLPVRDEMVRFATWMNRHTKIHRQSDPWWERFVSTPPIPYEGQVLYVPVDKFGIGGPEIVDWVYRVNRIYRVAFAGLPRTESWDYEELVEQQKDCMADWFH